MRRILALAAMLLSGCIPQVERPEQPRQQTSTPVPAAPDRSTQQCLVDLRREGFKFTPLPDRTFAGGCSALGAVRLIDVGTPSANLGAMTCPLALRYARWTREALQPAAERWLGSRVARIESFGTYSCRPVNSQEGGRLSEHGRANAVDIGAFVLADGRRITVLQGWHGDDERVREFLRDVHQAGCRRFGVTLGPDANEFHRDHFHFDMGPGPYCR